MSTEVLISIIGIGMIGTLMTVLLRQYHPVFAMVISCVASVLIFLMVFRWVLPIIDQIRMLFEKFPALSENSSILLRAVGICFLTQISCGLCRDAGESAIAAHIETAGKIVILAISLPMFAQILDLVTGLLGG